MYIRVSWGLESLLPPNKGVLGLVDRYPYPNGVNTQWVKYFSAHVLEPTYLVGLQYVNPDNTRLRLHTIDLVPNTLEPVVSIPV